MYCSAVAAAGDCKIKRLNSFGTRSTGTLNVVKCKNLWYVPSSASPLALHKGSDKLHICRFCKLSKFKKTLITCHFRQFFIWKIFFCVSENFDYQNIISHLCKPVKTRFFLYSNGCKTKSVRLFKTYFVIYLCYMFCFSLFPKCFKQVMTCYFLLFAVPLDIFSLQYLLILFFLVLILISVVNVRIKTKDEGFLFS